MGAGLGDMVDIEAGVDLENGSVNIVEDVASRCRLSVLSISMKY